MKKITVLFLFLSVSCSDSKSDKITIATGLSAVASIIRSIAEGINMDVISIIPDNSDPHQFNLKPSDVAKLTEAQLIFVLDDHLDGKLVLESVKQENIVLLNQHNHHDDHHHHENPHLWLSFVHSQQLAEKITDVLINKFPHNKEILIKNKEEYIRDINQKLEYLKEIKSKKTKQTVVVQRHHVWDYLLEEIGIDLIGTLEEFEGAQPSLKKKNELIQVIKAYSNDTVVMIDDEFSKPSTVLADIAKETGNSVKYFNPIKISERNKNNLDILYNYGIILLD